MESHGKKWGCCLVRMRLMSRDKRMFSVAGKDRGGLTGVFPGLLSVFRGKILYIMNYFF